MAEMFWCHFFVVLLKTVILGSSEECFEYALLMSMYVFVCMCVCVCVWVYLCDTVVQHFWMAPACKSSLLILHYYYSYYHFIKYANILQWISKVF